MPLQRRLATTNLVIKNRRAHFEYVLLDKYLAGMALTGTEVKSVRMGNVSLQEAYCYFMRGELWVKGMHIAAYVQGNLDNHVEHRDRKLLLHKKELSKLLRSKEKGLTIVPLQLFMNERGWAKLQVALAKGKKLYDKRQQIKERDLERAERRNQL